jgi:streptogramin lyase
VVIQVFPAAGGPLGITSAPDGNLWFTESVDDRVSRMSTAGVVVGSTEITGASPGLGELTTGPDGNIWFVQTDTDEVGRITPAGVRLPDIPLPGAANDPIDLAAGPDSHVWVAAAESIFRISAAGVVVNQFAIPGLDPFAESIAAGPDGAMYFTQPGDNEIGRITPSGGGAQAPLPTPDSDPLAITAGPDGAMWFTESGVNRIGRVTVSGAITEFPIPTPDSGPEGIAPGPDGNLWFTETGANQIGRITPSGAITEFGGLAPDAEPSGITAGPDGRIWFTELGADRIGRVTLDPPGVTTGAATGITTTAATLTGSVDPNAAATSYHFEYGLTTAYGSSTTVQDGGSGDEPVAVSAALSGLRPDTTYHFRLVATSPIGTTFGADATFTTVSPSAPPPPPPAPPAPVTGPPVVVAGQVLDVRATRVTLTGTVNPNGLATQYRAECRRGSGATRQTPPSDIGADTAAHSVRVTVTSLRPDTGYRCRLVAANAAGVGTGEFERLTTHARFRLLFADRFVTVPANEPVSLRYRSTLPARIVAQLERRSTATAAQTIRRRARRGVNHLRIPALTAGRYALTVRARARDGQRTSARLTIVAVGPPGACPAAARGTRIAAAAAC